MSGVFGIVDTQTTANVSQVINSIQQKLSHFSWYTADTYSSPDNVVGLGHSGIGILNKERQPYISQDASIVVFMAGELYRTNTVRNQLQTLSQSPLQTDLALVLSAYRIYGSSFARHLEGVFSIVLYDSVQHKVVITNDRFGLYPLYYAYQPGKLAFAPEVKGVLCAPFVQRQLNIIAAAEYFRFQQLLGHKTFHQNIAQFPYASVGEFDLKDGTWCLQHYWNWDEIPDQTKIPFDEAVIEAGRLLRSALARLTSDDLRLGVFLSGGLDSRTIIGLLPPRDPAIVTATFGLKGCRDQYYAEKIARVVGSRHEWFDLPNGDWVLDNLDLHLALTEGFHSWMHMHSITMLPKLREIMDYNLTGWAGEFPLGYPMIADHLLSEPIDQTALTTELYHRFTQTHTWPGLTEAEARQICTRDFHKQIDGLAYQSMVAEFKPYLNFRPSNQVDYFFLINHCGRLTGNMIKIARSHLEVRFPYWDYQFIDFVYSLNHQFRWGQPRGALYMELITREIPQLVTISYDKDELLPTTNQLQRTFHALTVRTRRRLGLFPHRPTLYADYENYLRHELRKWAENLLFDSRTEERGIFNMPFVRSLLDRHMSGKEEWTIGKIAPLMTFEMVMRNYFDD